MSISGISNGVSGYSPISQPGSFGQTSSVGTDRDGDGDNSNAGGVSRRGGFASAISQALSQLGVSGTSGSSSSTSSTGSTSATQDPQQAIRTFMHDLFSALRSTNGGTSTSAASGSDSDGDQDGSGTSAVSSTSGRHYGASGIESKLQSLIQQLSSSSDSSSSGTSSSNSALAPLQQDFQNMLGALGASGSQATLGSFLQSLSQNLQGANPVGNLVSTQA